MTTLDELEKLLAAATPGPCTEGWRAMTDILKALDDLGELLDQLAGNAREFDFHATNRMERDAAKALLAIEAAVNALPELLARVRRLEEALKPFADEADKWANCIDKDAQEILIAHPIDVTVDSYGEIDGLNDAAFTLGDLRRARAALKETGQ